jgi:hypothetical protein
MRRRIVNLEPLQYRALWGGEAACALTLTHADGGYNFVLKEKEVSRRIWAGKEMMRVFGRREIEGAILIAFAILRPKHSP